jgi:DNA-binding transcriptional LysR family regulator
MPPALHGSADDLLAFVAVVADGSFTKAARSLGVTKQAVSSRIARLERRLGVRLLERTTRRLRATDAGAAFYERSKGIAAQIDEAEREARDRQARPTGLLRVTAPYLFGRRFLAPIVADFMREHPEVSIELVLADRRVNLVEEGFDLAIRVGQLDDSSLTARRLGRARASVVAAKGFPNRRRITDADTLVSVPAIGMRTSEEWTVGRKKIRVRPKLVVNDLEIACDAAVAGLGVASLPELVTESHLLRGALVRLFPEDDVWVPVHAVFPSREYLASKVRAFLDALLASGALSG